MTTPKLIYSVNEEYDVNITRYKILRKITEDGNTKDTYLETQNPRIIPETPEDIYHVVQDSEVNRLDIISFNHYGTPWLWWAIALANGYIDPFVVNQGDLLRIPPLHVLNNPDNRILSRG